MSYLVLCTGCSLICAGFAAYFAWRAGLSQEAASHSEHRLSIMRGQVKGLEVAVVALDEQHKKLAGRVYVDMRKDRKGEQPELMNGALPACDNWTAAQREGPASAAAGCECQYCNAKRAERAARRANLRAGVKS